MADVLDSLLKDQGWLVAELDKFLRNQHIAEQVAAETRQRRIARELGHERRALNGMGRVRMEIDPYSYHYWGQRLGYQCWKDKQFLHEFERDNPHARVQCGGTQLQVGFGSKSAGARKKFAKSYG